MEKIRLRLVVEPPCDRTESLSVVVEDAEDAQDTIESTESLDAREAGNPLEEEHSLSSSTMAMGAPTLGPYAWW